jgi:DNA-damage-inducible protein D
MEDIKLFESKKVRSHWDAEVEKWYFSIVDIVEILTNQPHHQGARNYWKVLKNRLLKEGNETVTNCNRLKMLAEDGKLRETDVGDAQQLLRLINPSHHPKQSPLSNG